MLTTQANIFRKTIIRSLGGAAPEIFTRVTAWPSALLAHTTAVDAPPPNKKIIVKKFGLIIQRVSVWATITSGILGVLTKLFQGDVPRGRGDKMAINFRRPAPPALTFGRAKKRPKSARFLTTFDFDREYLRNGSTLLQIGKYFYQPQPIFHVKRRKKLRELNLVHRQKSYRRVYWPTRSAHTL